MELVLAVVGTRDGVEDLQARLLEEGAATPGRLLRFWPLIWLKERFMGTCERVDDAESLVAAQVVGIVSADVDLVKMVLAD
jgi:hypothetical protein